jgi:hypothetical protein
VLAVAVCAVLAGAVTFAAVADWVRDLDAPVWTRLGFTDRIPNGVDGVAAAGPCRCRGADDGTGRLAARTGHAAGGR